MALEAFLAPLASARLLALDRTPNGDRHPQEPHQSRDDPIHDFTVFRVAAELEAESAVDDAERDESPTQGHVRERPHRTLPGALKNHVVHLAEEGLDREEDDDQDPNDGVVVVDLVCRVSVACFGPGGVIIEKKDTLKPVEGGGAEPGVLVSGRCRHRARVPRWPWRMRKSGWRRVPRRVP